MASPYLLLELVLRHRSGIPEEGRPGGWGTSAGYALQGAYAIELDEGLRRLVSHRLTLSDAPFEGATTLPDEAALLGRVIALIEGADCLVTGRGRQLDVPVLEALALRHGIPLRGHFPLGEPYAARRSPYNPAGHLDLSFFLADGDRRLRALGPELLVPLTFPAAARQAGRELARDDLGAARRRALAGYLLLLRLQAVRGKLSAEDLAARTRALGKGLSLEDLQLVATSYPPLPASAVATALDGCEGGELAFDIETALDTAALARCLGRPVDLAGAPAALGELLGSPTDFAPAPFHKVVALAMVHWNPSEGAVALERLVLGGTTNGGAPLRDEATLLTSFWRVARGKRLLSYNGKRFDLPVLLFRALPYAIDCGWYLEEKRPPFTQYRHPQSSRQLDVFEQLSGGLSPGRLGDLLQTVGLPGKQGTTGNDVEELWAQQDLETLGDYCLSDAAQTLLLALRFLWIAGALTPAQAQGALTAARDRFAREPALAKLLAAARAEFFGVEGSIPAE